MQHKPPNKELDVTLDPLTAWHSISGETGGTGVREIMMRIHDEVLCKEAVPADLRDNAQLVIAEVLNNVAEHSYRGKAGGKLQVKLGLRNGELEVETQDFGQPMPHNNVPIKREPNPNVPRYALPEGGFGWFLIHTLAPNPVYMRRGKTNILQFTVIQG